MENRIHIASFEELERQVAESPRNYDLDLLRRAYKLAEASHKGQRRKSGEPYITHPVAVAELLLEQNLATGYESEEYGFTIESVDGVTADWAVDSAYWALYEGDEYATTSAAGILLTDGGVYKLVYETF